MGWSVRSLRVLPLSLLVLLSLPLATAHTETADDHPDPGISPSFDLFPTHDEVLASIETLRASPWVTVHDLGATREGRPVRLIEVRDPASTVPVAERVVTFIFTQQHGNEPAGTPAVLALLKAIADGDPIGKTLENQVLLVLPMANPDGATANTRGNSMSVDINRDHIALETTEARLLHRVLNTWNVHVAMDHHEYSGIGLGNPFPVRVYDYDLTTAVPNHGNVRSPTSEMSRDLMYKGIWPAAEKAGITANEYGEQTVAGVPVQQVAGGPDPGIMRNHIGLHHVAGLLVETRVDENPNPFHDAARREAIHRNVMEATLQYVNERAAHFIAAKAASAAATLVQPDAEYLEGDLRGPLSDAYQTKASLDEVFMLHGFPTNFANSAERWSYDLRHALRGHEAAALHPASTRRLADAVTIAAPAAPEDAAGPAVGPQDLPGFELVAAALSFGLALAWGRRRS